MHKNRRLSKKAYKVILIFNIKSNFQQCESNEDCADNLRRYCSGCRLRQCLEVGMKANYVRELNIKRIRRRIEKIPKHERLLKFSETLDPFQV